MPPIVHILATCRNPDLLPYTLLVFDSLRTGFPSAKIHVHGNDLKDYALDRVRLDSGSLGATFVNYPATIHHVWLEQLLANETEPSVLLDTDVVIYENVEGWQFETALAGARIPEWQDEFTNAITRARLHPSLLFVNPVKYREAVAKYESQFPVTPFNPLINLVYPICQPFKQRAYFSDTLSLAYHAIGGTAFTDRQLDGFFHFGVGTLSDIVLARLTNGKQMAEWRENILKNPELGRGQWRSQLLYYENHQPIYEGADVITKSSPEQVAQAFTWKQEMCKGNDEAMQFCDLWYGLIHGVDDLLDCSLDGRPLMSKQQMLRLFLNAAALYNCKFFVANRDLLYPVALNVTMTFSDALAWEQSSVAHLRTIADVLRMTANDMYCMVALICGGIDHRDYISRHIKEIDWLKQHTADGYPI